MLASMQKEHPSMWPQWLRCACFGVTAWKRQTARLPSRSQTLLLLCGANWSSWQKILRISRQPASDCSRSVRNTEKSRQGQRKPRRRQRLATARHPRSRESLRHRTRARTSTRRKGPRMRQTLRAHRRQRRQLQWILSQLQKKALRTRRRSRRRQKKAT